MKTRPIVFGVIAAISIAYAAPAAYTNWNLNREETALTARINELATQAVAETPPVKGEWKLLDTGWEFAIANDQPRSKTAATFFDLSLMSNGSISAITHRHWSSFGRYPVSSWNNPVDSIHADNTDIWIAERAPDHITLKGVVTYGNAARVVTKTIRQPLCHRHTLAEGPGYYTVLED